MCSSDLRQPIIDEARCHQLSGIGIVDGGLAEHRADALRQAAMQLADRQRRVDDPAEIVDAAKGDAKTEAE